MRAATGLQIDRLWAVLADPDRADTALSHRRRHRHRLHQLRRGAQFLIGDPCGAPGQVPGYQCVERLL